MKTIEGFTLRNIMGQATIIGEGAAQVDFNKLITLNPTAAFLWESVEGEEFEVDTLAKLLVEKYGINNDLAKKDAANIAAKWIEVGIVE